MNVYDKLLELFKNVFEDDVDLDKVSMDARLVEDLGMQSIGMLYMAVAIDEEFGVKFTNDDFSKIRTVKDIVEKIEATK